MQVRAPNLLASDLFQASKRSSEEMFHLTNSAVGKAEVALTTDRGHVQAVTVDTNSLKLDGNISRNGLDDDFQMSGPFSLKVAVSQIDTLSAGFMTSER